jgi:uncharacterized protein (TIGR03435 family)
MIMRTFANLAALAVVGIPVLAQSPPPPAPTAQSIAAHPSAATDAPSTTPAATVPAKFGIVDIHKSPPRLHPNFSGGFLRDGRYILHQATMDDLITTAYSLKSSIYVGGGPSWLDWDRYDIVAKVPPGTTPEAARLMLQSLLAERFKLVAHRGDAMVPAFLLTVANGKPNLKPSNATDGSCEHQSSSDSGPVQTIVLSCHAASLSSLAAAIDGDGGGGYLSYPVIDATGLKGDYDFNLKWTQKFLLTRTGPSAINIFQALEQQLGLKLDFKTTPRPGLVVDSVNEHPMPNSPQLDALMPPLPPPQFEVATIRPTDPNNPRGMGRVAGDELNFQGIPLKYLITLAWDLDPRDETTLIAPGWLESDRVDIHAKIADSDLSVNSSGKPGSIEIDDLRPMLRTLLIDRFQIKYHMEDRPANAFTLIADHSRLDRADPSERTGCTDGPGRDGKDPRMTNVMLNSLVTCRNMTMDQFAEALTSRRGSVGYLFYPVLNATGLKGAWDFTISWSSADLTQGGGLGPAPASPSDSTASDPNGAISYYDALKKEHGLKLVKEKRPEPVLVIDQINKTPSEN